jgi:peptidyl-prolyl cis-trans isomerase SurA
MPRPRSIRAALSLAAVAAALACVPRPASAVTVERVVAVIGDRPILLTELRHRARPFLLDVVRRLPPGAQAQGQLAAAESSIFKELLEKMIDEELEMQAADRAKVSVTSDEVDNAIKTIASSRGIDMATLLREAQRTGLTEMEYREELRRQLLEGKMLQLRVKGRVRITEEDVKAMYERTLRDERKRREYEAAWIVLRIYPGSSADAIAQREALARQIVNEYRSQKKPFAELARLYSDDSATREKGGDLGVRAPQGSPQALQNKRPTLGAELEAAILPLEPGQISEPFKVADAIVILQLVDRQASRYTTYDAAKPEMLQRLQTEILEKAKRKWLEELKAKTHLEVRL